MVPRKAKLSLDALDDRIVPDATPFSHPLEAGHCHQVVIDANGYSCGAGVISYDADGTEVRNYDGHSCVSDGVFTYPDGHTCGEGAVSHDDDHTSAEDIVTYDNDYTSAEDIVTYDNDYTSAEDIVTYDNGSDDNPYGDDTTILVDFTPTEPAPPTDTPPAPPTDSSDTLTEPAPPPAPQPGPIVVPEPPKPLPGNSPRALTDLERAEIEALRKAIGEAEKTVAGINVLKAAYTANRVNQVAIVNRHKADQKEAEANLVKSQTHLQGLVDAGYFPTHAVHMNAAAEVAIAKGIVIGLKMAVATAQKPADNLQQRIDYCDTATEGINAQTMMMTTRVGVITLAVFNGTSSGTPPMFAPITFTAPDPDWANNPLPTPTPTPVP